MNKYSCLLLLFFPLFLFAQEKATSSKKVDKLYEDKAYSKYIEAFNKREVTELDQATWTKLADSYKKTGDTKNAELLYGMLVAAKSAEPSHIFYYAQALHANGKYQEAKTQYLAYDEISKSKGLKDNRGTKMADACEDASQFKALGEVKLQNEKALNSARLDFSPSYYKDGLIFVSTRGAGASSKTDKWTNDNFMDLYFAKRKEDGSLETPKLFSIELNSRYHEGPSVATENGEKLFFTRNNYLKGKKGKSKDNVMTLKIYAAKESNGKWEDVEELSFNNNEIDVCHPAISPDGRTMVFARTSDKDGQGGMDLYVSFYEGNKWSAPVNLGPDINTPGNELFPFIHSDGTLFFASNGHAGLGGLDIYMAHSIGEAKKKWSFPLNIGAPFNTNFDDFGFILDLEQKNGYFSSNREGGMGQDDIYSFKLEKGFQEIKPSPLKPIQICVFDKNTGQRVAKASVKVIRSDEETRIKHDAYTTNSEGVFSYNLHADKGYTFEVSKIGYSTTKEDFILPLETEIQEFCIAIEQASSSSLAANNSEKDPSKEDAGNSYHPDNFKNAAFDPKYPVVKGIVKNSEYNRPLEGAEVVLLNRCNGEELKANVGADGLFAFKLECGCDYVLKSRKNNFIGANKVITLSNAANCKQPMNVELMLAPGFDKLGNEISIGGNVLKESLKEGDVIELKNIYYDLDKYDIREDATADLDELAALMKQFPSMYIELSSHTDSRGSRGYNRNLSTNRAKTAREYLIAKGIAGERIKAVGYGEGRLRNKCRNDVECSEYEHQRNRRTEVFVTKIDKSENIKFKQQNNEPKMVGDQP